MSPNSHIDEPMVRLGFVSKRIFGHNCFSVPSLCDNSFRIFTTMGIIYNMKKLKTRFRREARSVSMLRLRQPGRHNFLSLRPEALRPRLSAGLPFSLRIRFSDVIMLAHCLWPVNTLSGDFPYQLPRLCQNPCSLAAKDAHKHKTSSRSRTMLLHLENLLCQSPHMLNRH
jgi:hypothetical protein